MWPVVTEAMFLLADRPDVQEALWRSFEGEAIRLLPLGRDDIPRIRELMWKYRDRRMDFAVYRLSGRRRLKLLP